MSKYEKIKRRVYQIIEVGYTEDEVSRFYDIIGVAAIILNLIATICQTYDNLELQYGNVFAMIERGFQFIFVF